MTVDISPVFFCLNAHIPARFAAGCGVQLCNTLDFSDSVDAQHRLNDFIKEGMCEWTAWAQIAAENPAFSGVIITTACDQMRRASECFAAPDRLFCFNMPATARCEEARLLFESELHRLERFFIRHGGTAFNPEKAVQPSVPPQTPANARLRIGLLGSPLFGGRAALNRFLADHEAALCLDLTENGDVQPALNDTVLSPNPYEDFARFAVYDTPLPDPFSKPNAPFFTALERLQKEHRLDAWMLVRTAWCDQWRGIYARLKEVSSCPATEWILNPGTAPLNDGRTLTRIEAFLENLS